MSLTHFEDGALKSVSPTNPLPVVNRSFSYANIASQAETVVKTSAGFLHSITINDDCAGAITIYDNDGASGDKIGTIKAATAEGTYTFDVEFLTALTIVTAAACDLTISYK